MIKLHVIIASTRPTRVGDQIGRWVVEQAGQAGGFDTTLVDLAEINLPFLDEPQPAISAAGNYAHEHTRRWSRLIAQADAFIIVMPEYNHTFSAPLKNALDYLYAEWHHKPVGLVSYGLKSLGLRAAADIKPALISLKLIPVAEYVAIPLRQALDDENVIHFTPDMEQSLTGVFQELKLLGEALAPVRARLSGSSRL